MKVHAKNPSIVAQKKRGLALPHFLFTNLGILGRKIRGAQGKYYEPYSIYSE
jgi:hypothetical protein